jgi:hypothetical protein
MTDQCFEWLESEVRDMQELIQGLSAQLTKEVIQGVSAEIREVLSRKKKKKMTTEEVYTSK